MAQGLRIIAKLHGFILWLIRHIEKFPRHYRDSLGNANRSVLRNDRGLDACPPIASFESRRSKRA